MRRIIAASSDIFLLWPTFSHIINLIHVINTRLIRILEFYSHRVQIFIHSYRLSSNYIWSRHFGISSWLQIEDDFQLLLWSILQDVFVRNVLRSKGEEGQNNSGNRNRNSDNSNRTRNSDNVSKWLSNRDSGGNSIAKKIGTAKATGTATATRTATGSASRGGGHSCSTAIQLHGYLWRWIH